LEMYKEDSRYKLPILISLWFMLNV
jgi:hypothetical protein